MPFLFRSFLLSCFFYCPYAMAQQAAISGVVKDTTSAIPAATVSLLNAKDSSWIRSALTDDNGAFTFTAVSAGNYLVSVTAIGHVTAIKGVLVTGSASQPLSILLQKETTAMKEVTVTGRKPFIEMGLGKVTVNIDGSPTAVGMNILDVLRRMPGISVDMNGNISMQGKQGVLVLIDDRPTYLSPEQLADYLKTIPTDEITQIELITQPPAKYDAAGNAGIINIKRKKTAKSGWSGTATLTAGEGIYPFALGNALVNYHHNKLNISLAGNEHKATGFADWIENQRLTDMQGNTTSIANTHSTSLEHFSIANLRLAADYDASDKASMGASIKGGYHTNAYVDNVYSNTFDEQNNTTIYNNTVSPAGFIRKDLSANTYFSYKFNSARSINFNADYISYSNSPYQDINNTTYDAQMQPLPDPLILHSYQPSLINVYSIKGDYTDTLRNGTKLEAGFKSSLVNTNNNAEFSIYQNNVWMPDTTRTNRFVYKENINALYISADRSLGSKWEVRVGLRAEQTNAQGVQQVHDQQFDKSYISLFPTAYVTYKQNKDNQFELNYGRRIDRPSYQSLNPFIYYSFQYSYSVGNPYLQPQYTNNVELKHSYKNMLITTLDLTSTTGVISDVLVANSATGVVYSTQENIGTSRSADISMIFNKDLYKWWSLNAAGEFLYAIYNGPVSGIDVTTKGTGYSFSLTNQFSFTGGWKAECVAYYIGRYIQSIIATSRPVTFMSFGVTKKLSEASTIKMEVNDPFYLYRNNQAYNLPNLQTTANFRYSSQGVSLSYTCNFGKGSAKDHELNESDESKRIKSK